MRSSAASSIAAHASSIQRLTEHVGLVTVGIKIQGSMQAAVAHLDVEHAQVFAQMRGQLAALVTCSAQLSAASRQGATSGPPAESTPDRATHRTPPTRRAPRSTAALHVGRAVRRVEPLRLQASPTAPAPARETQSRARRRKIQRHYQRPLGAVLGRVPALHVAGIVDRWVEPHRLAQVDVTQRPVGVAGVQAVRRGWSVVDHADRPRLP